MSKQVNLAGQRFSNLAVIGRAGSNKWGDTLWRCRCDCGNITTVVRGSLKNGQKSCGCITRKKILTGSVFGKLKVIEEARTDKGGRIKWRCVCECGKETIVQSSNLINGHTKTCGHCFDNQFRISEDGTYMIGTTKNQEFIFDIDNFELVKSHSWSSDSHGYIHTFIGKKSIRLHRLVINAPESTCVDHINRVKSDNRRCNLRLADHQKNAVNRCKPKNNTSGAKGVFILKRSGKFNAYIRPNGRKIHLGNYDNLLEASNAYDKAAEHYFGEYACLNNY